MTFGTASTAGGCVAFTPMETIILVWDDLDDFAHACRHLATSAFAELVDFGRLLKTCLTP
jgi:hypothetical protein